MFLDGWLNHPLNYFKAVYFGSFSSVGCGFSGVDRLDSTGALKRVLHLRQR